MNGDEEEFVRQVAMHVAATSPETLNVDAFDPASIEMEKRIQMDMTRESGMPGEVTEKMVAGWMKKWLVEVTHLNQAFVVDFDQTVGKAAKESGVEITGFVRLAVGEGIEKAEEDFAAEVAKAARG